MRLDKNISAHLIKTERLRGARMSVYFRWAFITLIGLLLFIQMSLGYKNESVHGFTLLFIYLFSNLGLWLAVRKQYDPPFLGYLSAFLDVGIICYHLYFLTSAFDHIAATAAATTFLLPVFFLLYTFRLDRYLLYFLILIAVIGFNFVYFFHYFQDPELYSESLSLSPTSHLFKTAYIFFIGVLCVYLQHVMSGIIKKQVAEASEKLSIDSKLKLEEERHKYALELIEKEKQLNRNLEQTIQERTKELTKANTQLLKLQKENLQSQFEVLKQQVNPHFLFNSLNVLTSLIKVDPDLAETFTERLSKVYRYVLENKDKDLVTLATEMDFLRAYVFLIDIRFQNKVFVHVKFNEAQVDAYVVPLALQLLIENAIKHNTFSKKNPLHIEMFVDDNNCLNVVNNLQDRETHMSSTGVGLINITKRYTLLSNLEPIFERTQTQFIAKIPLLKKDAKKNENE